MAKKAKTLTPQQMQVIALLAKGAKVIYGYSPQYVRPESDPYPNWRDPQGNTIKALEARGLIKCVSHAVNWDREYALTEIRRQVADDMPLIESY